jgi:hypothetical protein
MRKHIWDLGKTMLDGLEYYGEWWIPGKEEKKIKGILKYMPRAGTELKLFGILNDIGISRQFQEFEIIHGIANNGTRLTLYKCIENILTRTIDKGPSSSKLSIGIIFENIHFSKYDDFKTKEIYARYSFMGQWLGLHGFKQVIHKKNTIKIEFQEVSPLKFKVAGFNVTFEIKGSKNVTNAPEKKITINQNEFFVCKSDSERHIDEMLKLTNSFQDLLSFVSLYPATYISLQAVVNGNKQFLKEDLLTILPVNIYFQLDNNSLEYVDKAMHPNDFIFNFNDLTKSKMEKVLNLWISNHGEFDSVRTPYFRSVYSSSPYLEEEFMNMVRTVESYSYEIKKPTQIKGNNIGKRINDLISTYLNKIDYINQFNFMKTGFGNKIEITRHYYTHNDYSKRNIRLKGLDLFKHTIKLKVLSIACFMKYLKFSDKYINKFFMRNRITKFWLEFYARDKNMVRN